VLYRMVMCRITLTDPDLKVTAFVKSNISKTVCLRDKVAIEHQYEMKMVGRFVSVLSDVE